MTNTQATQTAHPAKRGDLILVERHCRDYFIGQPNTVRTEYHFGVVASVTRDGKVKSYRSVGWGDETVSSGRPTDLGGAKCWVASKTATDVAAAMIVAKAHCWDGHPGQPRPFDTKNAASAAVAHCKLAV